MSLNKKITVIIIVFHNSKSLLDSIEILENLDIIIVDNGGNSYILNEIKSKNYKNVKIITNNKNLGFGMAFNRAAEIIVTEYILLLAPDSIINLQNVEKLSNVMDGYSDCAIAVPKIYKNGKYKPEDVLLPEKEKIIRNADERKIKNSLNTTIPWGNACIECFLGSIMLINKKYFGKNIFDERYFLYFEDIQLCKDVKDRKKSIILVDDALAYHEQYGSVKKNFMTLFIIQYNFILSKNIYFQTKVLSFFFPKNFFEFY